LISAVRWPTSRSRWVDEQPRVELRTGELRHVQGLEAFADRRAGDRDGVDDVGLAALTAESRAPAISELIGRAEMAQLGYREFLDLVLESEVGCWTAAATKRA
jgi:hypothetical protein